MICGKVIYGSRDEALQASGGIKGRIRSKKKPVQPYHCDDCKGWHLTSNKKKPKTLKTTTHEITTKVIPNNRVLKITDLTFHPSS